MRVLVTGSTGFLGQYVIKEFESAGHSVIGISTSSEPSIDITDRESVQSFFLDTKPEIVIHCAAFTHVDSCESVPEHAHLTNVVGTANIARAMSPSAHLIYISTDMVYSGAYNPNRNQEHSWAESPVNVYGLTKYMGELEALRRHSKTTVLRTNFYSRNGGFLAWMQRADEITLYNDVYFSPLHIKTLCEFIVKISKMEKYGVYNLGSHNGMSKLKFGIVAAHLLGLDTSKIRSVRHNSPTPRPLDMRMNVSRAEITLGLATPSIETDIIRILDEPKNA